MKTRRVKMSLKRYHQLPFKMGWKQEYINGHLVERPRPVTVYTTLPVKLRASINPVPLRAVKRTDVRTLLPCFRQAFIETIEYCDYTKSEFAKASRESLEGFFHRPFDRITAGSSVALAPAGPRKGRPIGAALVAMCKGGWAQLEMLFVSPEWQRKGIATALVHKAVHALHELGYVSLISRYQIGNEVSAAWHHRLGFADEPNLFIVQLRLRAVMQELRRQKALTRVMVHLKGLVRERERLRRDVRKLETALEQGRERDAFPWRKWVH